MPAALQSRVENIQRAIRVPVERSPRPEPEGPKPDGFVNNPFAQLEINR